MRGTSYYSIIAWLWCLLVFNLHVEEVLGHGMLLEPVSRGSMWRNGYRTPINYNDNENFCGGFAKQWYENEGECGACGDDYSLAQPRPNENTGTYGLGIVVATYEEGSWVNLSVMITANHRGYFEFSICSLTDPNEIETEECFAKYPLSLEDGSYSYALNTSDVGLYPITVKLPDGLTCDRCVLRWDWTTGNNWGLCTDEEDEAAQQAGALGCGPQETFRTCTDISVL